MSASGSVFKNLLKNSSMMFALNLAGVGVSVFTIPITLHIIGVVAYGHLVLVQSIALSVFTVCGFQYWQGMLVALPGHRISAAALRQTVCTSLRYEALALAAVLLALPLLHLLELSQTSEFSLVQLVLLALSAVLPVIGTNTAYFRLVNRYNTLMFAGLLANALKLFLLHLVARYDPHVSSMVLAYALPEVVRAGVLLLFIFLSRTGVEGALDACGIDPRRVAEVGRWSTLQAICDLPVAQVDRVIIGFALPGNNLAVFSILKRIYSLVNLATAPFYSTSVPEFAARANGGDAGGAFALWIKTMKMLFCVTLLAALVCYAAKALWMPLIFADLVRHLDELKVVLLTAVIAGTFVTTHALYWALGKLRQTTAIAVASNALYLLVLWGLTVQFGLLGAVSAFLVHVVLVALLKTILLRRLASTLT